MQKLSQNRLPKHIGAFVNLGQVLDQAITQRGIFAMNMSGYPVASHAVARMQQYIDLTTPKSMLQGIMKLRDLCRFSANVLDTIPLAKVDKFQLVKTELIAFIGDNAASHGVSNLSETEKDFVAYLITSAETADGAWILDFTDQDDNRVLKVQKLYKTLLTPASVKSSVSADAFSYDGWDPSLHVIYDPEKNDIVNIQDSRRMKNLINDYDTKLKDRKNKLEKGELALEASEAMNNAATVHHLALLRIVDHVSMLLNDNAIWSSFLSARTKADASTNQERSKSLRLAASYMHSILMYPHIHALELFMHTYEKLQDWMKVYPALPADVVTNYNNVVRAHDFLHAGEDAGMLLNLIETDADDTTGSKITGIPLEIVRAFGLSTVISKVQKAAHDALVPLNLTDLKQLDNEEYRYILLSFPVSEFDMTQRFSEFLYIGHATAEQLKEAIYAVNPGLQTYYKSETIAKLKSLSARVPFGYSNKVALTDEIMKTTSGIMEHGKVMWRPLTPRHSYDYQHYLRHDKLFTIFGGGSIMDTRPDFFPDIIINKDAAHRLRSVLMKNDWKTLMPAGLAYSEKTYSEAMLRSDINIIKQLLEDLTGMNYNLLSRQITAPYFKTVMATYLSGFALFYAIPDEHLGSGDDKGEEATKANLQVYLVPGYGNPYGTTYANLAAKQGPLKPSDLIKLGKGAYMRILKEVPVPQDELAASPDFYISHPYYYYPSNSDTIKVKDWVLTDGLLNFALAPILGTYHKPEVVLDQRHAYMNDKVYIQTNMLYSVGSTVDSENHFAIPLVKRSWSQDYYVPNIEYITHGEYSKSEFKLLNDENTPINQLVTDLEENVKKIEADTAIARIADTETQAVKKIELAQMDEGDSIGGGKSKSHKPNKKKSAGEVDGSDDDKDNMTDEEEKK